MRHIFLPGLSGSGKSTIGRILALCLGKPLFDVDALIEEECGEHIPAIFAQHGEDYFRACKSRMLVRAVQSATSAMIVVGATIVVRPERRASMVEYGICVHLHNDLRCLQLQYERALMQDIVPETRPLLADPDPLAAWQLLYSTRRSWYKEVDLTCETRGKSIEQVV